MFTSENYQEELYFPCTYYILNQTKIKKLKQHYKTINCMKITTKVITIFINSFIMRIKLITI